MDAVRYSAIVRTYNEEEHVGKLLVGLLQQQDPPSEIIVVDSGSTDATLPIVSRFPVRVVTIDKQSFSFGRSLNVGCEAARYPLILIASAHVYPLYRNWTRLILAPFQDEKVGLVFGGQCGDDKSYFSERQIMRRWFPGKDVFREDHTFCNNANAAIRKSLWDRFQYNEELSGLEDVDWARRVVDAGYRIVYEKKAEVVHVHRQTWEQVYNRYYREAAALKQIYPHERFGRRDFFCLLISNIISDCTAAFRDGELFRHAGDIVRFRIMQFLGTYRGFYDSAARFANGLKQRMYYPPERVEDEDELFAEELRIRYTKGDEQEAGSGYGAKGD